MDDATLNLVLMEAEKSAEELNRSFLKWDIDEDCYARKIRVKKKESVQRKIEDRQKKKENYQFTDITDLLGVRIVTLYRQQTLDVLKKILDMLDVEKHDLLENYKPIKPELEEAIVYVAGSDYYQIGEEAKNIILDKFDHLDVETPGDGKNSTASKGTGYSSIHLVGRLKKDSNVLDGISKDNKEYLIPVEIQIRCAFEDIWGEIDHSIIYSLKQGKDSKPVVGDIDSITNHIKILKRYTDTCADYANQIYYDTFGEFEPNYLSLDKVTAVNDPLKEIDYLGKSNLNEQQRSLYDSIKNVAALIHSEPDKANAARMAKDGIKLTDQLMQLRPNIRVGTLLPEDDNDWPLQYFTLMDYAMFHIACRERTLVSKALNIYQSINEKRSGYPVVLFRRAQITKKLYDEAQAIPLYEEAYNALINMLDIPESEWGVRLLKEEAEVLAERIPCYWAYAVWIASTKRSNNVERVTWLRQAASIIDKTIEHPKTKLTDRLINDKLYYLIESIKFDAKVDLSSELKEKAKADLEHLEEKLDLKDSESYDRLHTLMCGYFFLLGNLKKAKAYSIPLFEIITRILENPVKYGLSDERMRIITRIVMPDLNRVIGSSIADED